MMDIGFNIIHRSNPDIFKERISIIQFLKDLNEGRGSFLILQSLGLITFFTMLRIAKKWPRQWGPP